MSPSDRSHLKWAFWIIHLYTERERESNKSRISTIPVPDNKFLPGETARKWVKSHSQGTKNGNPNCDFATYLQVNFGEMGKIVKQTREIMGMT